VLHGCASDGPSISKGGSWTKVLGFPFYASGVLYPSPSSLFRLQALIRFHPISLIPSMVTSSY